MLKVAKDVAAGLQSRASQGVVEVTKPLKLAMLETTGTNPRPSLFNGKNNLFAKNWFDTRVFQHTHRNKPFQ